MYDNKDFLAWNKKYVKPKFVSKIKFAFRIVETKALQKKTLVSNRNSLTPL